MPVEKKKNKTDESAVTGIYESMEGFDKPLAEPLPKNDTPVIDMGGPIFDTDLPPSPSGTKKPRRKATPAKEPDLNIMDGEDIQMFVDLVVPITVTGIHNLTSNKKMSPDDVMLTSKQEEKMNRLCQRMADKMKMGLNPVWGFAVGVVVAYGGNYMKNKP